MPDLRTSPSGQAANPWLRPMSAKSLTRSDQTRRVPESGYTPNEPDENEAIYAARAASARQQAAAHLAASPALAAVEQAARQAHVARQTLAGPDAVFYQQSTGVHQPAQPVQEQPAQPVQPHRLPMDAYPSGDQPGGSYASSIVRQVDAAALADPMLAEEAEHATRRRSRMVMRHEREEAAVVQQAAQPEDVAAQENATVPEDALAAEETAPVKDTIMEMAAEEVALPEETAEDIAEGETPAIAPEAMADADEAMDSDEYMEEGDTETPIPLNTFAPEMGPEQDEISEPVPEDSATVADESAEVEETADGEVAAATEAPADPEEETEAIAPTDPADAIENEEPAAAEALDECEWQEAAESADAETFTETATSETPEEATETEGSAENGEPSEEIGLSEESAPDAVTRSITAPLDNLPPLPELDRNDFFPLVGSENHADDIQMDPAAAASAMTTAAAAIGTANLFSFVSPFGADSDGLNGPDSVLDKPLDPTHLPDDFFELPENPLKAFEWFAEETEEEEPEADCMDSDAMPVPAPVSTIDVPSVRRGKHIWTVLLVLMLLMAAVAYLWVSGHGQKLVRNAVQIVEDLKNPSSVIRDIRVFPETAAPPATLTLTFTTASSVGGIRVLDDTAQDLPVEVTSEVQGKKTRWTCTIPFDKPYSGFLRPYLLGEDDLWHMGSEKRYVELN